MFHAATTKNKWDRPVSSCIEQDQGRNERRFRHRRSGFGELRKEREARSVTANPLVNAAARQRYVHVD